MTHIPRTRTTGLACAAAVAATLAVAAPASAGSGGLSTTGSDAPRGHAKINRDGTAVAPRNAPPRVVKVIEAANKIEDKPYEWGGGHARWRDNGYDCSGAVSFALHGGDFVDAAFPGLEFDTWGKKGKGSWITVYASSGHIFMTVAGLRWDTGYTDGGDGPSWSTEMRPLGGFEARHPRGF